MAPVGTLIRHAAPEAMYRLRTACGREVTLTGDHNLWVLREGHLALIETADARPTDYLPLPISLDAPLAPEALSVDLVETLPDVGLYVHAQEQIAGFAEANGAAAFARPFAASGAGNPYVKLFDIRSANPNRGGIGTSTFRAMRAATGDFGGTWTASGVTIAPKGGTGLPAHLTLTPSLLYLLGIYAAEGHATESYVTLASRDAEIRDAIETAVEDLGLPFSTRPSTDYQISSRVLAQWLRSLVGSGSTMKRLPPLWPSLSDPDLGTLLRGYFDGDGTVERANAVTATTASEGLASDLAYALFRFGIWARLRRVFKRATNSDHEGAWYWQITISGQDDLHRFSDHVGFGLTRKQDRLTALLGARGNTNVDVLPISGADLRSLRQDLGLSARALGALAGVTRSAVQSYETETRRPSRPVFRALVEVLEAEALRRNVSEACMERLSGLRRLLGVRWTPVAEVTPEAYPHPYVYDLSVPGPETFLAGHGGLFVHNTFSLANVIQKTGKPTLVLATTRRWPPSSTRSSRTFFPDNAVELLRLLLRLLPARGLYPASRHLHREGQPINEEIDRLRLRATDALLSRRDVIDRRQRLVHLRPRLARGLQGLVDPGHGRRATIDRDELLRQLSSICNTSATISTSRRGTFRVRGDAVEVFPADEELAYRIEFFGDEVERIATIDPADRRNAR